MGNLKPDFNYDICMACRVCVTTCPFGCLDTVKTGVDKYGKSYPEMVSPDTCTGCGLCVKACPVKAMSIG